MSNPTHYYRPQTLAEAIQRAAQPNSIALDGGALTLGGVLLPFETVVDLQDLVELKRIQVDADGLHIGGSARLQNVVESPDVPDLLKRALTRVLPLNIRCGASVSESLATPRPPCEWLTALTAMQAIVEHAGNLQSTDESDFWEESVAEFVNLLYQHGHPYQGVVIQVRVPHLPARTAIGTAFVARTPADKPILNAAVRVTLVEDGTVAETVAVISGASDTRVASLHLNHVPGKPLADADLTTLTNYVEDSVSPVDDYHGSREYRRKMAGVCVRRALEDCRVQLQV
jgi:CO/xanthine dehydrogenase FAD-binding subunit